MSRDKQIEEMAKIICGSHNNGACVFNHEPCDLECSANGEAKKLYDSGYRKASEVTLEAVDDFQRSIRHIFLDMCNGNDYNTLNLLQIDSAIEALFDCKIAELKKKYTEDGE